MEHVPLPLFGPGTRVEVAQPERTLLCRLCRMQGRTLHLSVPGDGAQAASWLPPGGPVRLTLSRGGACWEARATIREWLWTSPPTLVVGPVLDWREMPRRRAVRRGRQVALCLSLESGARLYGRTLDISSEGISLLLAGAAPLAAGNRAHLTLQLSEDEWSEAIPIRIARQESWLGPRGRSLRVGAAVEIAPTAAASHPWRQALQRLGIGAERGERE